MNNCPFCGKDLGDKIGCVECGNKLSSVLARLDELSDGGRFVPVLDFKDNAIVGLIPLGNVTENRRGR